MSSWKCKIYIDEDLYIADSKPTSVKRVVGHDSSAAVFNSLDFAKLLDEREASIRVCHIQASKVVVAGYLQGSNKTLNGEHWTEHLNWLPCLKNLDVEVQIRNIEDPTSDSQEPGYKMNMSKTNAWRPTSYVPKKTRQRSTSLYAPRTAKLGQLLEQLGIFPKDEL